MAGLAIFSLKYPSLLMFDQHARSSEPVSNHNLRTLFGLSQVPCDSQMRAILDPVNPSELRGAFRAIHSGLQRSNSLKDFQLFNGKLLLSIDGTGAFSSTRISFNAAKNQDYHMEHSYGHAKQYLSSVLGGLMLLAFLIDQVQESFCRVFGEIRIHHKSRRNLWKRQRAAFTTVGRPIGACNKLAVIFILQYNYGACLSGIAAV